MRVDQQGHRSKRRAVHERLVRALSCVSLAAAATAPAAFEVVPTGEPDAYLKWGRSHVGGTPGGVITWGLSAPGTPGSDACGDYCAGASLEALPHFYAHPEVDNRITPMSLLELQAAFRAAFDAWSSVADLQFKYLGIDRSMLAVNDPAAESPMIRIGIYAFDGLWGSCMAGAAFAPPPNGATLAGDIFINANVGFQRSDAPDGSELLSFPAGNGLHITDVYLLALHEIGHAIGLGDTSDPESVLCGGPPSSATLRPQRMRRQPSADDVAGAQFLYGPPGHR